MWEVDPETRSKLHQISKKEGSGNDKCCDCGAPSPQWASPKFSTFICLTCAGTHRSLGVHISFVRSVSMDAFKQAEILRMQHGGNKAWQDFFTANSGVNFDDATIKERYDGEVGEEWKERLTAKVEGRDFDLAAWKKEREVILAKQASRSATPVGAIRSDSPARGGLPAGQKSRNEAYFAKMGEANATRPDGLAPSQGGKYAGFGSGGASTETGRQDEAGGIPSADEFQKDPVAALTKGFGWFSGVVGKQAKMVNDSYIQPTAKTIASSDFAAQAKIAASQAGQGLQLGAKGAAESFNKFVEGRPERRSVSGGHSIEPERKDFWDSFGDETVAGAGAARKAEPERKDFWDSFGDPAAETTTLKKASGIGTSAMKGGPKGSALGGKGKEEGWSDDW